MKTRNWLYVGLIFISMAWIACDDDDNDGRTLGEQDKEFIEMAARANLAEIEFGGIAVAKGDHEAVREFGEMMVTDHQEALEELEDIEDAYGNVDFPDDLDQQHEDIREQLMDTSGYAFDTLYIRSQIADHEAAIELFEMQANNGDEQRLKDYANKYLPHLREHLDKADSTWNVIITANGQ